MCVQQWECNNLCANHLSVKVGDCFTHFSFTWHRHKTKASWPSRLSVKNHPSTYYFTMFTEQLLKACIINAPWDIADVDPVRLFKCPRRTLRSLSSTSSFVDCQESSIDILLIAKNEKSKRYWSSLETYQSICASYIEFSQESIKFLIKQYIDTHECINPSHFIAYTGRTNHASNKLLNSPPLTFLSFHEDH